MRARRAWVAGLAALGLALASPAEAQQPPRTIYSSLPLQGVAAEQAAWVLRGEQLALEQAGGRAGGFPIRLVSLDDSTAQAGYWTPEETQENALRAARDRSTIAYVGEFNSGATAISLPILNEAGIPQVSPSNTAIGLTRSGPGAERGEPDKYYPSGIRSYARVVPNDRVQAHAILRLLVEERVRRVYVVDDGETYGSGIATLVRRGLRARGIRLAGRARLGRNARSIAARVRRSRAGAMVYGGIPVNVAEQLFDAVHRRNRRALLVGSDAVAAFGFTETIRRATRTRTRVMVATLPPSAYPNAQAVVRALRERHGAEPDPYALFGYEAMSVVIDAINRAGAKAGDKAEVARQLFATRDRESILGRYSIDPFGDTTLSSYGVYRVAPGGALEFERAVDSAAR